TYRHNIIPYTTLFRTLVELGHLRRQRVVDLDRALREQRQQIGGDAGDLGLTFDDLPERQPIPRCQLGPEDGLVEAAERALVALQDRKSTRLNSSQVEN